MLRSFWYRSGILLITTLSGVFCLEKPWLLRTQTSLLMDNDSFKEHCEALTAIIKIESVIVHEAQYIHAGTNLSLPDYHPTCKAMLPSSSVLSDICRITMTVTTSSRSELSVEAWFPLQWSSRLMTLGNGGLSGCIQYYDLAYTTHLGFAAITSNNGHNGTSGESFYRNDDTLEDFAYRSILRTQEVGKKLVKMVYEKPYKKSYYFGCSTGGRQGLKFAQIFPDSFDGIIAGAPAIAFNSLLSWSAYFYLLTRDEATFKYSVPKSMWPQIYADIMSQCDNLDGVVDGVIEDPVLCQYQPENLICSSECNPSSQKCETRNDCLSYAQAIALKEIYKARYLRSGELMYPRMVPGSEKEAYGLFYSGKPFNFTVDWFRYAIYSNLSWSPADFNIRDAEIAIEKNPFDIETWNGDLSGFKSRGGKLLTYHGTADGWISPEITELYYNYVADTMGLPPEGLDDFYRHFRISGMGHCSGGPGPWKIGQWDGMNSNRPYDNILMAMVEWVEGGQAPKTILGRSDGCTDSEHFASSECAERYHCRYPQRKQYLSGGSWRDKDSWHCI